MASLQRNVVSRGRWLWSYTKKGALRTSPKPGHVNSTAGLASPVSPRRGYSTGGSVRSNLEKVLDSRLSFRLANGIWAGVAATLLYYVWRRRKGSLPRDGQGRDDRETPRYGRQFNKKVVVITGGAGDIGSATGQAFAREGATVVLVDLPHTEAVLREKCVKLLAQGAANAFFTTVDVTKKDEVKKMARFAVEKAGGIDCFFNNAGIQGELKPLHMQNEATFQKVLQVNTYGVFLGMKYVAQAMMERGSGGVIVNAASLAGLQGPPNMGAYAASKFAVVGMTKTAAKDFAPYGIRVCAVAPGLIDGKMWPSQVKGQADCLRHIEGKEGGATEEELQETERRIIDGTPMKRLGRLSEVASVVVFLCSEEASYLTGNIVPIDGGRLN